MFLPLRDENPRRRRPLATMAIIALCVTVWVLFQGAGTEPMLMASLCRFGAIPGELTGRAAGAVVQLGPGATCALAAHPAWYTVLTSMFLHGGWLHLIGNLWFLWIFGDNIEDLLGRFGFLVFYLACGLVAAAVQISVAPGSVAPMVGASGAISGVMGAYIVLYPRVRVQTLVFLFIIFFVVAVPAYLMLGYWFVLQVLGALPQLGGHEAGVAFWAHVGGFSTGALVGALLRWRRAHGSPSPGPGAEL